MFDTTHSTLDALALLALLVVAAPVGVAAQETASASIRFDDRRTDAPATVTVQAATLPDGGFVAVYNESSQLIGHSEYPANGTHDVLTIDLSPALARSQVVIATLYRVDGDGSFDPETDTAYETDGGPPLSDTAYVTLNTDTPTPTDGDETHSSSDDDPTETTTALTDDPTETTTASTDDPTETTTASTDDPTETTTASTDEPADTAGPGFGVVAGALALLAVAALARRA